MGELQKNHSISRPQQALILRIHNSTLTNAISKRPPTQRLAWWCDGVFFVAWWRENSKNMAWWREMKCRREREIEEIWGVMREFYIRAWSWNWIWLNFFDISSMFKPIQRLKFSKFFLVGANHGCTSLLTIAIHSPLKFELWKKFSIGVEYYVNWSRREALKTTMRFFDSF